MDKNKLRTFSIASFNCRSIKRSVEQIRNLCSKYDIVALQETWLLPHDLDFVNEVSDDFGCYAKSTVDTSAGLFKGRPYGGLAILWRKALFTSVSVVECSNDRISAVHIKLDDRSVLLFSIYMPINSDENLTDFTDCLATIAAIIDEGDVDVSYILGDFNAHPKTVFGDELDLFCTEQSLICADQEILPSDTYTFLSESHGSRRWLDHCVVTRAAWDAIMSIRVDNNEVFWSDHFPLVIECDMQCIVPKTVCDNSLSNGVNEIKWGQRDFCQSERYRTHCIDSFSSLRQSSLGLSDCEKDKALIDNRYNCIIKILQKAAIKTCYTRHGAQKKFKPILGWNHHVKDSHQRARLHFNNWVMCGCPKSGDIYNQMVMSRKQFKSKLRWCQKNQENIKLNILALHQSNKDFIKFWNATKRLNYKTSKPVSIEGIGDPVSISEQFARHFSVIPLPLNPSMTALKNNINKLPSNNNSHKFSAEDVARAVREMKRGKSPGWDGLSIEHILHAGPDIYYILANLFSICHSTNHLPEALMKTVVVPVPKNKTGDLSSLKNYRPISLGTILGKILERLLHPDLNCSLEIDDAQFGFRPGLSTDSAIFSVKSTIRHYVDRKTSVYACFLDLSRAFDLVNYDLLWGKLARSNIPEKTVGLLRYWYENQTNHVRWGDTVSSDYKLKCGVRQGGLTSPDLFNLYINDLIVELRSTRIGCHVGGVCLNNISYADDMVLLSPSISALRKLLSICEGYAAKHGLKYNENKTQMMVFRAGKGPEITLPVLLSGIELKFVSQFKYLGHILAENLSDDLDIERERRALAVRCNMISRRFSRCNEQVKVTLFRAYCQSFYTCQLWVKCSKKALGTIRIQYNNAYRILMKLPRFCSASGMFAEQRIADFFAIRRARIAGLWARLRASGNGILRMFSDCLDNPILRSWQSVHRDMNA
ncbi:hypothetical protein K1T71_014712 [Dendrolimus kikuchii]|nr:hypothetical protein K1T71_014712 [Dendrolimus kikuchii]